jgi:predicted SprT family Zn-dependent metalloprotease
MDKLFNKRVSQCLAEATSHYGMMFDIPPKEEILLNFEYMHSDMLAHATGNKGNRQVQSIISLNAHYAPDNKDAYNEYVIPHEVSHIICFHNDADDAHGEVWKELCVTMGGIDTETLDIVK